MLTIVMYHYVRDLGRTRYPAISGMLLADFRGQLDYIQRFYSVVSTRQVINAIKTGEPLPPNACLLTFDDGYLDHFVNVFPLLSTRGLTGSFYVPVSVVEEGSVLQVNKMHFVLASTRDHAEIKKDVLRLIDATRDEFQLPSNEELVATYSAMSRWDPPDTAFIKKVLQIGLPESLSKSIAGQLFQRFMDVEETVLNSELYMSMEQLQAMVAAGMEIGGHGHTHRALGELSREQQVDEIQRTRSFLHTVYQRTRDSWALTYPSGSYNQDTLEVLGTNGCSLAMTTEVGLAELGSPLELKRINANDLPVRGDAPPNPLTQQIL